ncbi:MAG: tRNA (adenosine(37)-N6)-dimethylallyltransferase MiaA [Syntrophobacteraceae bacterium]
MESTRTGKSPHDVPVILLAGPTGVGKTALAITLAQRLDTEIINADSLQVYRYMDIGTAKPTLVERRAALHHLLDVVAPDEPFDAARYLEIARPIIHDLQHAGRPPMVVGGTGLYMKILTKGICSGPPSDPAVRSRLLEELDAIGTAGLHQRLLEIDPPLGARLHPNDRQRILRALEVFMASGQRLSEWQREHGFRHEDYRTIKLCLFRPREELYERINRRVDVMMEQGFLDEVSRLLEMGYGPGLKPMQSLGYKQLTKHLLEGAPLSEAIEEIKRESRRYAKRQLTWFRGDPEFNWLDPTRENEVIAWVESRLAHFTR